MKTRYKIAALSGLAVVAGALCRSLMIRMPLKEFTRCALYMAVMDDEICRNELEGNFGSEIRSSYFRPSRKLSRIASGVPPDHFLIFCWLFCKRCGICLCHRRR